MCLLTLCVESLTKSKKTVNVAVPGARRASRYARTAPNRAFGHSEGRTRSVCAGYHPSGGGGSRPSRSSGTGNGCWRALKKGLADFDFTFQPSLRREQIDSLHELDFFRRKENVVFLGPPGVGRTHLAISLAIRVTERGRRVYYRSLRDLARAASAGGNRGHGSAEWEAIRTDEVVAAAVLDRLLHRCHLAKIRGDSYRMRQRGDLAQPLRQVLARKTPGPGPVTQAETPR